MQGSNTTILIPSRVEWRWLFILLVWLVIGFVFCSCSFSEYEPLPIYPHKPLPNGSLIFTNHFCIFRLESKEPIDKPVTMLYTSTVNSPLFSPSLLSNNSKMVFIWSKKLPQESANTSTSAYLSQGVYLLDIASDQSPILLWRTHNGVRKTGDLWPTSSQWSADGRWVVFLIGNSDNRDIYRLDPESLTLERVMDCEGYCQFVASAPISNRLIFTSLIRTEVKQEMGAISILDEDGTITLLVKDKGVDYITSPSWSPDETQVAFTMQVDEQDLRTIFLVDTDGTNLVKLIDKGAYHSPVWSPNGEMLAVVEEAHVGERIASRIVLIDLQTREMQTLLTSPTQLDALQWLK